MRGRNEKEDVQSWWLAGGEGKVRSHVADETEVHPESAETARPELSLSRCLLLPPPISLLSPLIQSRITSQYATLCYRPLMLPEPNARALSIYNVPPQNATLIARHGAGCWEGQSSMIAAVLEDPTSNSTFGSSPERRFQICIASAPGHIALGQHLHRFGDVHPAPQHKHERAPYHLELGLDIVQESIILVSRRSLPG